MLVFVSDSGTLHRLDSTAMTRWTDPLSFQMLHIIVSDPHLFNQAIIRLTSWSVCRRSFTGQQNWPVRVTTTGSTDMAVQQRAQTKQHNPSCIFFVWLALEGIRHCSIIISLHPHVLADIYSFFTLETQVKRSVEREQAVWHSVHTNLTQSFSNMSSPALTVQLIQSTQTTV